MRPAPPVAAQGVTYQGGLSAATGRYGGDHRITTVALSTGASLAIGGLSLGTEWPLYTQNGTDVIQTGGGMVRPHDSNGAGGGRRPARRSSLSTTDDQRVVLGDPLVRLVWRAVDRLRADVAVGLATKAPLAQPDDFGTGEWDFGARADGNLHLAGPYFAGLAVAWWRLGDPPDFNFENPWIGSLMFTRGGAGRATSIHLSASTPTWTGDDPSVSVGLSTLRVHERGGWGWSVSAGLTDSAADLIVGLTWSVGPHFEAPRAALR